MNICLVMPRCKISGVPLAQLRLARALACRGHKVEVLIGNVDPEYTVPDIDGVKIIDLKKRQVRGMFKPLLRYLSQSRPDLVFSAEDHLNAVVLLAAIICRSSAKISCSSRVTPLDTYSGAPLTKKWWLKQLMAAVMWRGDALTCVSQGTVAQYQGLFRTSPHTCVYNIVDDEHSRRRMTEPVDHDWLLHKDGPILVAAGSLAPWKGYEDLIRAMPELARERGARLLILGDGPLRAQLEKLIISLGLSDSVCLLGYVENPLKYFRYADVFAHSAYVESLGNVLVEAMMCGCTPVSSDCPTGPREVLQGGRYGYLTPMHDPPGLACGIKKALDKPISTALLEEAIKPFGEQTVLEKHFEALGLTLDPRPEQP